MKLTEKKKEVIKQRITLLLLAGLDYCVNTKQDETMWFGLQNPYYCEAFGLLHTLEILGYGYFGPDNIKSVNDNKLNLNFWFNELKEEVKVMGEKFGAKNAYFIFSAEHK